MSLPPANPPAELCESIFFPSPDSRIVLQRGKGLANRGESSQKPMAHFPIRISEYRKRPAYDEDHSDLEGVV